MGNRTSPRAFFTPVLLAGVVVLITACGGESGTSPAEVTLSLTPTDFTLFVGETRQINASVSGAPSSTVSFVSNGTSVATVDDNGIVTAEGVGSTTITVTVVGEGVSATSQVTVSPSSIVVTPADATVPVGETVQLTATVTGGVGLSVSWSSSDESVATVDAAGLVMALSGGLTEITAAVDGQPGVEASAEVAVSAPPEALEVVVKDAQGGEADFGNVTDLLTFEFTVEGELGETAQIEVLVDDAVVATEEFTFEEPAAIVGVHTSISARRIEKQVLVAVDVLEVQRINDRLEELVLKGPGVVTSFLTQGTSRSPIQIRGSTSNTVNFNQGALFFVDGVSPLGTLVQVGDNGVTDDDVEVAGQILFGDAISRIEADVDGAAASYGADATAGVVNFILKGDNRAGFEGPTTFTEIRGYDAQDELFSVTYGNVLPRYQHLQFPQIPGHDGAAPTSSGTYELYESFFVGRDVDIAAGFLDRANWGPESWSDFSGFTHRYDVGPAPDDWTHIGVEIGTDLIGLDGRVAFARSYAEDPFGHSAWKSLTREGTGSPLEFLVDLTPPHVDEAPGPGVIRDLQLGFEPSYVYQFDVSDPAGADGPGSSGLLDGLFYWNLLLAGPEVTNPYPFGPAYQAIQQPIGSAVSPETGAHGPAEYISFFLHQDNAFNRNDFLVRGVYNPDPPQAGPITLPDGPFTGGADLTFSSTLTDRVELLFGAAGIRYDDVLLGGEDLYLITSFPLLGSPFDGAFVDEVQFDGVVQNFVPRIQNVAEGSHAPVGGWYDGGYAAVGAMNTASRFGYSGVPILDRLPVAGSLFGTSGMDFWGVTDAPSTLCNPNRADCTGLPTWAPVTAIGLIPGDEATGPEFPILGAQLFMQKRIDGDMVVGIPVSAVAEPTVTDFSTFREYRFDFVFDAALINPSEEVEGLFLLGTNMSNEALRTRTTPFSSF